MASSLEVWVVLVPAVLAAAAAIAGCCAAFGRPRAARTVQLVGLGIVNAACWCILAVFWKFPERRDVGVRVYEWLEHVGEFRLDIAFELSVDRLSAVVLTVVSAAGLLAAIAEPRSERTTNSKNGQSGDGGLFGSNRWLAGREAALLLTLLAACLLFMSRNLVQLFFCWQLVAAAMCWRLSLDGETRLAAGRLFLLCAATDIPFLLGILMAWRQFGSFRGDFLLDASGPLGEFAAAAPATATALGVCFLSAIAVRCAQFPVFGWVDATSRAAPATSILLHSSFVSVAAYLALRLQPVLAVSADAAAICAALGGLTVVLASFIAAGERDDRAMVSYIAAAQWGVLLIGVAAASPLGLGAGLCVLIVHTLAGVSLRHDARSSISRRGLLLVSMVVLTSGFWGHNAVMEAATAFSPARPAAVFDAERVLAAAGWCVPVGSLFTATALVRAFFRKGSAAGDALRTETLRRLGDAVFAWIAAFGAVIVVPALARPGSSLLEGTLNVTIPSNELLTFGGGWCVVGMLGGVTAAWLLPVGREQTARRNLFLKWIERRLYVTQAVLAVFIGPIWLASRLCRAADAVWDLFLFNLPSRADAFVARVFCTRANGVAQVSGIAVCLAVGVLFVTLLWLRR